MPGNKILFLGALAAIGGLWYYTTIDDGDDYEDDGPALSRDILKKFWSTLVKNMELHKYQIQQVLHQQATALAQRGQVIPDEELLAIYKQHFEESLENVQNQLLAHFNVTEEELEEATDLYKGDAEISKLVADLEGLYLGDGKDDGPPEVDVGLERLVEIISEGYVQAWCDAFEKTGQAFEAQGKEVTMDQQVLMEFHTEASEVAQENLTEVLAKDGLTNSDFQKLILHYQNEPSITAALQHAQMKQQDFIQQKLGLRI